MTQGGPSSRFGLCFQQHHFSVNKESRQRLSGGQGPVWLAARSVVLGSRPSASIVHWALQPGERQVPDVSNFAQHLTVQGSPKVWGAAHGYGAKDAGQDPWGSAVRIPHGVGGGGRAT